MPRNGKRGSSLGVIITSRVPVEIEHVLGSHILDIDDLTVGELLASRHLPETMFQPYLVRGEHAIPVPLSTRLSDAPAETQKILVRAIRNTLFETLLPDFDGNSSPLGSEQGVGFRGIRTDQNGKARAVNATVDREQARQLVIDQVANFAKDYDLGSAGCVFGVSGGGDSNALAYGLSAALPPDKLTAFTLVFGAVFTEAAAVRARLLCQDLNIDHRVLYPEDIGRLLDIRTSLDELYADFSDQFGHEALHFFGTFLILRTARKFADQRGFRDMAFGYNREDLLAELLFMLMNGRRPLAFPARPLGRHRVVMPVWQAPKLLLDACHPNFSLENYRERDPYTTRQRSLAFFLAHTLDSSYPSFGLSLLAGTSRLFEGDWAELEHDDDMDVFVVPHASTESLQRVRELVSRHFGHP